MRTERRTNKDGSVYYSFVTADRKRMTRKEIRNRFGKDIVTEAEAKECLKLLGAEDELKKLRIKKRLDWQKEFYNFNSLLEQYSAVQKKRAPNSWQNNVHYLKYYVLHYFLQVARLNNIELWSEHYSAFKDWLETAKTVNGKSVIAYASKNHAIKALNTFLDHLYKEKIISAFHKCETFGEHLLNERSIDDVIHPHEMETICSILSANKYHKDALYFRFLFFTGMRFNEGLAISVGDLFQGEIDSEFMKKKLDAYQIKYDGYLVSDGQFDSIDSNGQVIRAPFKGKKKIHEKFNRVIPIVDRTLWNLLVDETVKISESKPNERDILLFESIDDATFSRRIRDAFESAKLKYREPHCLRHSRATWLIGDTADMMLARIWLGHTSPRTIEKYNHIYQAIARAAKAKTLTGKKLALKRV